MLHTQRGLVSGVNLTSLQEEAHKHIYLQEKM